ncbi:GTP 3',8-cyclase MoaA [Candidatus Zixiibacteriota bacterium]
MKLIDRYQRSISYLRLSVTDRCNLHCRYCMPAAGPDLSPTDELLTREELVRLTSIFLGLGIDKLRITGGEPFMRENLLDLLREVLDLPGLQALHITTNGIDVAPLVPALRDIGISGVNLSLDTLDRQTFSEITGRDSLDAVLDTLHALLAHAIPVKINTVTLGEWNTDELGRMARLACDLPVEVRFIEEMPLIGITRGSTVHWDQERILNRITSELGDLRSLPDEGGTARRFTLPGYAGTIGIIAGHTRSFCRTCDRIRVNASGLMKTCLYGHDVLDLREMLRSGLDDDTVGAAVSGQVIDRSADGYAADSRCGVRATDRMSSIGG